MLRLENVLHEAHNNFSRVGALHGSEELGVLLVNLADIDFEVVSIIFLLELGHYRRIALHSFKVQQLNQSQVKQVPVVEQELLRSDFGDNVTRSGVFSSRADFKVVVAFELMDEFRAVERDFSRNALVNDWDLLGSSFENLVIVYLDLLVSCDFLLKLVKIFKVIIVYNVNKVITSNILIQLEVMLVIYQKTIIKIVQNKYQNV